MHIEINNYTGHENTCEINYYDSKGDYNHSLVLDNLETELYVNIQGINSVRIVTCNCKYYDDLVKLGNVYTPSASQLSKIEKEMSNCIDWESWHEKKSTNVDDFLYND